MGDRRLTRSAIDKRVARAWDRGAWTLSEFTRATKLPERTIEESCLRLYKSDRINFDPVDEKPKEKPKAKARKKHGNRKQQSKATSTRASYSAKRQ